MSTTPGEHAPALTAALLTTGRWLQAQGYRFTTVTPATQARVNARPEATIARDLRDVFGWNRPFMPQLLPPAVRESLASAGLLQPEPGGLLRAQVRFAGLRHGGLYAHGGWPTAQADAVFFGPDTVRFTDAIVQTLAQTPVRSGARVLDMGCGAGPGGLVAAGCAGDRLGALVLADINPCALAFAAANVALAGVQATLVQSDLFARVEGRFDLIVANPPYLNDGARRAYRHGGGVRGEGLSLRIVREGLPRLAPGGLLLLYTGVAMDGPQDPLVEALRAGREAQGWPWTYRELDPDVFGEELEEPAYARCERIAAVLLTVRRPA